MCADHPCFAYLVLQARSHTQSSSGLEKTLQSTGLSCPQTKLQNWRWKAYTAIHSAVIYALSMILLYNLKAKGNLLPPRFADKEIPPKGWSLSIGENYIFCISEVHFKENFSNSVLNIKDNRVHFEIRMPPEKGEVV